MTDFVLPTLEDMQAFDLTSLTISDSDVGLLTAWQGAIIKNLVDQMSADEIVHIRSPFTATGKTEKFILDNIANSSNLPNIVTSDRFQNEVLDCSQFNTLTGNHAKVFKFLMPALSVLTNDEGDITSASIEITDEYRGSNAPETGVATADFSTTPTAMSSAQLSSFNFDKNINKSKILNASGDALGSADDDFAFDLGIAYNNPMGMGYPEWEDYAKLTHVVSMYNNLPVNGALIVFSYNLGGVITAAHSLMNALNTTGRSYEYTRYRPSEDVSFDTIVFKKLSV